MDATGLLIRRCFDYRKASAPLQVCRCLPFHEADVTIADSPHITAEAVSLTYADGHCAVRDVKLSIARGEFVSIVGPSGCGKSTLLRMIAGLIEPTCGALTVAGRTPLESRRHDRNVAFVFQDANLLPWRTVTGNIRLPLELQGVSHREQTPLIEQSLRLIGLSDSDARKRPHALSGGMKMRVSLARALVTRPRLLLLDEPFGALDDLLRQRLNEDVSRIWQAESWTGLFVTHNVSEAVFLSRRVIVMSRGPGTICGEVAIDFDFPRPPRLRNDARFARLTGVVSELLEEAAR
jgi:NitT/TauT family transport system ATP-binding protein